MPKFKFELPIVVSESAPAPFAIVDLSKITWLRDGGKLIMLYDGKPISTIEIDADKSGVVLKIKCKREGAGG